MLSLTICKVCRCVQLLLIRFIDYTVQTCLIYMYTCACPKLGNLCVCDVMFIRILITPMPLLLYSHYICNISFEIFDAGSIHGWISKIKIWPFWDKLIFVHVFFLSSSNKITRKEFHLYRMSPHEFGKYHTISSLRQLFFHKTEPQPG